MAGADVQCSAAAALRAVAVVPTLAERLRQARGEGETWQAALRQALRWEVDVVVSPVFRVDGVQVALGINELQDSYERRRLHMAGRRGDLGVGRQARGPGVGFDHPASGRLLLAWPSG